jgi:hypothetical protein
VYWKKIGLIVGALATVPAALFVGVLASHFFFMHFVFTGDDNHKYWAGDAIGDFLYASVFGVVFVVLGSIP